jgi:energy-coupling factor transport system substrate-specific component
MFAWGIMGFLAGMLAKLLRGPVSISIFGFFCAFFYGWIMDLWTLLGFVNPINAKSIFITYAASFYFDLTHAVATAVFLLILAKPWLKILDRVKIKYGLMEG